MSSREPVDVVAQQEVQGDSRVEKVVSEYISFKTIEAGNGYSILEDTTTGTLYLFIGGGIMPH